MVCIFLCPTSFAQHVYNFYPNGFMTRFNHFNCCIVFHFFFNMPKFIRSTIDKYLECLQSGGFWVVLLWIFLYIFFIVRVHTFLTGTYLGVELTECGICLWWNLVYDVNVYENGCTNLHHYVQINSRIYRRGHIAPPLTILKHFILNSLALLVSVMWQSPIMGYISLMTNEVEHLFTHLVAIWVSVLEVPV